MAPRRRARIEVTGRPAALPSLPGRRRERSRLDLVFAVVALLAQIAGPVLHSPVLLRSANGDPPTGFDARALCLAPGSSAPGPSAPADKAPEANHDFAACCVWHGAAGAVLAAAVLVEPVAFAESRVAFAAPAADLPTRRPGDVRARAPPAGA